MRETPIWRRYLRLLGSNPTADVDDELEFHFSMRVEDLMKGGRSESEAREQARREFGDVERVRSEMEEIDRRRDRRHGRARWWDALAQDLRFAGRTLRKSPGFTAIAVLTLAVGIGASTAMFTLVNSVLLRPLDYRDPESLVMIWERTPEGDAENPTSPANFTDWREQARSFTDMAASHGGPVNLTAGGEAAQVLGRWTTTNFFPLLGAGARFGRTYLPGEEEEDVVVLSHELWRGRFGGDPAVVGSTIQIDGYPWLVIGVMPADFRSVGVKPDLWRPRDIDPEWRGRFLEVVGRLRPGTTLEQARTEMTTIGKRLEAEHPQLRGWGVNVVPMHEQVTGGVRPALLVLLGAVALLLLIACSNVANLLLARAAARRREVAVRLSLGATRGRLIRQTLTESLVLAALAGALGLLLAVWGTRTLVHLLPSDLALPRADEVSVDGSALAFALGVSLLTGVLFGIAPALFGSAIRLAETLRESTRGTTAGRSGLRRGLVITEVALAVVLLVGAGLLGRSLRKLMEVDTGVRTEGVLTMRMTMSGPAYQEPGALTGFVGELLPRLEALPGAGAAGGVMYLPLTGEKMGHMFWRADRPRPTEGDEPGTDVRVIAGDYFGAMGIPLVRGRAFDARDDADAPPVFMVNEELARQNYPGEDPIGKPIAFPWIDGEIEGEIVGVVGNVRELGPTEEPSPALYRPFRQMPVGQMTMVVRSERDPMALAPAAAAVVREIDPGQPVAELRSMDRVAAETVARRRFTLYLLGGFAAVALLLAGLGLYGIISYSVAQRRGEIGVRLALGAQRADVVQLVLRQGMVLTAIGVVVGLAAALASTRVMASLLYGVGTTDPLTLAGVVAFLAAVALLASYLPARRATRVDPMIAMRAE